jgi:ABC-type sugar transport system ATPase subunit
MRYEFASLHRRLKTTMVYVTHDQIEAMTLADRIVVLNGGVIEQVGAPMALYENPRTRFVAEFIGSPRMNLIAAEVVEASVNGASVRTVGGEILHVAVNAGSARAGQPVMLGVRPEHLTLTGPGDAIQVRAAFVETLGNTTYAYVTHPGASETLTVQLSGDIRPAVGEALTLHVDPAWAHLFDAYGMAFQRNATTAS